MADPRQNAGYYYGPAGNTSSQAAQQSSSYASLSGQHPSGSSSQPSYPPSSVLAYGSDLQYPPYTPQGNPANISPGQQSIYTPPHHASAWPQQQQAYAPAVGSVASAPHLQSLPGATVAPRYTALQATSLSPHNGGRPVYTQGLASSGYQQQRPYSSVSASAGDHPSLRSSMSTPRPNFASSQLQSIPYQMAQTVPDPTVQSYSAPYAAQGLQPRIPDYQSSRCVLA